MAESNTFQYLENDSWGSDNAAQQFMKSRLAKNKYTVKEREALMESGGPAVVNAAEGVVPGGSAYDKYKQAVNKDGGEGGGGGGGAADWDSVEGLSDWARSRYKGGTWGAGNMSIEELRSKFNLSADEGAASGERAIYGYNPDGTKVFIGAVTSDLTGNSELVSAHSKQAAGDEIDHSSNDPNVLSSDGDVKGAILNLWKGGEGKKAGETEYETPAIEHSPEIKQAKERVRNYEDSVMSGKLSNDIFGGGDDSQRSTYTLDLNKGAAGIGTNIVGSSADSASKATTKFLENKVSEVKAKKNFQPT